MMPKIVDHEERRERISAAAAEAIGELGLDRVRLVDVAKRAGCTTGAVSHYFPDKDAVLAGALDHVLGNLSREATSPSTTEADDPVTGVVDALAEVLPLDATRQRDWIVWIAFCGRAVAAPALAARHREAYARLQAHLAEQLATFSICEPGDASEAVAAACIAALDGLGLRAALEPACWPAERLRAAFALQLGPVLRAAGSAESTSVASSASASTPRALPRKESA